MNTDTILAQVVSGGLVAICGVIIGTVLTYCVETFRNNKEGNKQLLKKIYLNLYTEIKYLF
jgi:ABC-type branched-subunit amino acid transport system permease subunit